MSTPVEEDLESLSPEVKNYRFGRGGWPAFHNYGMPIQELLKAAEKWAEAFEGIEKPWLVWNAHPEWCIIQQNLVESVGWTPIVGFDPRLGPPEKKSPNAIIYNFNSDLDLLYMSPMFVIEFLFCYADKMAMFHSDFLLAPEDLAVYAKQFEQLKDGETIATSFWRLNRFWRKPDRHWELLACNTRAASKSQFDQAADWWCNIHDHINCPDEAGYELRKTKVGWDHTSGILFWEKYCGGTVHKIPLSKIEHGHFSPSSHPLRFNRTNHEKSRRVRDLKSQLDKSINIKEACAYVGLDYDHFSKGETVS
ncbi:hypothetical protein QGN29_03630 [Temperatibacter marinus]|uniref:Uncharacterized protein n=1 Tax=Temperatibacter marinus TaxID=1456591 RepID=A0AA52EK22_9PROT|nr:hypothetical protein [Temperatibacter marinus]WND03461.1 hypothetical protein QGN29_03630 [Temperatibacter marinus]